MKRCERVAAAMGVGGMIRIDCRRRKEGGGGKFLMFDVNLKPVSLFRVDLVVFSFIVIVGQSQSHLDLNFVGMSVVRKRKVGHEMKEGGRAVIGWAKGNLETGTRKGKTTRRGC